MPIILTHNALSPLRHTSSRGDSGKVPLVQQTLRLLHAAAAGSHRFIAITLRTGDADLRFYITTVQDG